MSLSFISRPRQFARRLVFFFCTLALAPHVRSADTLLTLAQAQRLAVERSRQIAAQDMAAAASRDMAVAAGRLPDPVLKLGIDNLPVSGADRFSLNSDFMTMKRIGLMQEFTGSEKRQLRAERYQRSADKNLAEKDAATAAVQRDAALAWLDRYYLEKMNEVVAQQAEQARLEIQAAEGAYRAGRGGRAELIAARSALAMVDDSASEIGRRLRNARTMLARWVGNAAAGAPLAAAPELETIRLDPVGLDAQLAHHPQIAVLARQEDIARTEARLAQADKRPDWSLEVMYSQRASAYGNMVSIGVSLPLQWDRKNRQEREVSARLAQAEQAGAEREEALRAHVAETQAMIDEWQTRRERQARYRQELIPLANEKTLALVTAYRGGKATLADVLAARRGEIDTRLQSLQLQAETARLWAQLNYLAPHDAAQSNAALPINGGEK